MKKLNVILDETTIINFHFFKKLLGRYIVTSILTPLVVFSVFIYHFKAQNSIYFQTKSFKNISNEQSSPIKSISKILGDDKAEIAPEEIIGMLTSLDFHKLLAENLLNDEEFGSFNLTPVGSKRKIEMSKVLSTCNDDLDCKIKIVAGAVGGLYSIKSHPTIYKKFDVEVRTLDKWTTRKLLLMIESSIQDSRLSSIRHLLLEQKKLTSSLLNEKRASLEKVGASLLDVKIELGKKNIGQLSQRLSFIQRDYQARKVDLDQLEAMVVETRKTLKKGVSRKDVARSKKARELVKKIERLRQDISAIELSLDEVTGDDNIILQELKRQHSVASKSLLAIKNYKGYIDTTESFINKKGAGSNKIQFDVKVKRTQLATIKKEMEELTADVQRETSVLSDLQAQLIKVKPDLAYIKLLENRLIQLTLLESTVVTDFLFGISVNDVSSYKKTTKGKNLLFATFVSLFLLFSMVITRYLFDSKIYDEYELSKNFENVEVIGNTPDFN